MEKRRLSDSDRQSASVPLFGSTRLFVSILGFLGTLHVYACRVNLSVAIVCMLNNTALEDLQAASSLIENNGTVVAVRQECDTELAGNASLAKSGKDGEFVWTKDIQGYILGSFFWGYLFTQILGGLAAQWLGAKRVIGWSVFCGAILSLLTPVAAHVSYILLIFVRILLGFAQGVIFPGVITLWTHWAPPFELGSLSGLHFAGCQVGNVITLPLAGLLCEHGFAGGWPSIFYVLGMCSLVWFAVWMWLVSDTPAEHKRISERERHYIQSALQSHVSESKGTKNLRVPWKKVLTSRHVWAILVGHVAADWGAYIMLTCLPSFMSEVLGFEITTLGFLASIPYILYFICINVAGVFADFLIKHRYLSIQNTRRLMMTIALGSQAVFLIAAAYCSCGQEMLVVALLTIGQGLSGFQYSGIYVNYIDIAPPYAGAIVGVGNMLSCFSGILAPFAMGVMTPNKTRKEWEGLFWLTFAILVIGTLVFDLFCSGEIQPWARVSADGESEELEKEKYRELQEIESSARLSEADAVDEEPAKYPLV